MKPDNKQPAAKEEVSNRQTALDWWAQLSNNEVQSLTTKYYSGKLWTAMTGVEIEKMWESEAITNSEDGYTKGEWIVEKYTGEANKGFETPVIVIENERKRCCIGFIWGETREQSIANAELIASAPQLKEQVKILLNDNTKLIDENEQRKSQVDFFEKEVLLNVNSIEELREELNKANSTIEQQNVANEILLEQLKGGNDENDKLKRSFYMDICRAYNAGKQNQINIVVANGSPDEDKMFLSSHDYFKTEFPEFKTNVP